MKARVPVLSLAAAVLPALLILSVLSAQPAILLHEDFATLENWKPFEFPKIRKHSTYRIERLDGRDVLRTESNASASAILYRERFSVYEFPTARWRWRVENVYAGADAATREGDDYPIRIYVLFDYDPDTAGFGMKLKYGLAKTLYGVYPPHSSLSYVWASKKERQRILPSPYTDRARMILLREGAQGLGAWQDEQVDILEDYRQAFGAKPPDRARIAIMNDSDNTGESSVSFVDFIEVAGRP